MSVFTGLLNHDFALSRLMPVSDGQGGWTEAWLEMGTIRGRMRPVSGQERQVAMQEQRHITHILYVVASTDIQRGDRVELNDLLVEIQGVREPSEAGHHLEVDCLEVQLEPAEVVS